MTSKPQQKKGIDRLLIKLTQLPAHIHLIGAVCIGAYATFAILLEGSKFLGVTCLFLATIFVVFGFISLTREMNNVKAMEKCKSIADLQTMTRTQFERYLIALYNLQGFQVNTNTLALPRTDDVDFIATKKKEVLFVQYNHWDEDTIEIEHIRSLHKAASLEKATGMVAITLGQYSDEARSLGIRKGVTLLSANDLIRLSNSLVGNNNLSIPTAEASSTDSWDTELPPPVTLFVDFAGLDQGIELLDDILSTYPRTTLVASTLPENTTLDDLKAKLPRHSQRIQDQIDQSEGQRYYAIQKYMNDQHAPWLALDSNPRQFPEGCTDVVIFSGVLGFDVHCAKRLKVAIEHASNPVVLLRLSDN